MGSKTKTIQVSSVGRTFPLKGYVDDSYLNDHLTAGFPELDLMTISALILEPGDTILDIGANLGFYTVGILKILEGKARIYSFEPSKKTFEMLKNNIELNGYKSQAKPFNYGLSDKQETVHLYYNEDARAGAFVSKEGDTMDAGHSAHESISIKVLDEALGKIAKSVDFMKIDIEGHEPNFLKGAKKSIKKNKPAAVIEANHWCLNAFNHTSLPDFLEQVTSIFPYVYAFDVNNIVNVRENKLHFLNRNILHNELQNLYCDFDLKRANSVVAGYQKFLSIGLPQPSTKSSDSEESSAVGSDISLITRIVNKLKKTLPNR